MSTLLSQGLAWFQSLAAVERMGWLLVHTVWQYTIVALLASVLDRLLRRASANTRYFTLLAAMLLIVLLPIATWQIVLTDVRQPEALVAANEPAAESFAAESDTSEIEAPKGAISIVDTEVPNTTATPTPAPATTAKVGTQAARSWPAAVIDGLRPWLSVIVGVWCMGVVLFSIRPFWSWCVVRRLQTVGVSPVSDAVQQAFDRMRERLAMTKRVCVRQSTLVNVPVVVGCFRSVILLPASFISGVPVSQLEAILAHELAHVRRYDYPVNLVQTLVETLFFYHPAVWWLSHRIRIERENGCDDLVVAALGNKVEYGRALLAVEEFRGATTTLALSAKDGSLLARVKRLFAETSSDDRRGSVAWVVLTPMLLGLAIGVWAWTTAHADEDSSPVDDAKALTFAAQVTDTISVELLAVNELRENAGAAWKPNGRLFDVPPEIPAWRESANRFAAGSRHLGFQWKGLNSSVGLTYRMPGLRLYVNPDETGIARVIAEPTGGSDVVDIRVGMTDVDWGPWQKVDRAGELTEPLAVPLGCREAYDTIKPDHIQSRVNSTMFCWLGLKGFDDLAQSDIVAVATDGTRHKRDGRTAWDGPSGPESAEVFDLPLNDIDHFEYRLRPYRHWVTFANVSLDPATQTDVQVSVDTVPTFDNQGASSVELDQPFRLRDHGIIEDLRWTNSDQQLVTVSLQGGVNVRRWDVARRKLLSEIKLQSDVHGREVTQGTLRISADGRQVIGVTDAYVGIWDVATGQLMRQLQIPQRDWAYDTVRCLCCSADGSLIVAGLETTYSRTTRMYPSYGIVWNANSGEVLCQFEQANGFELSDIAISQDGQWFVTLSRGQKIGLWETHTGKLRRDLSHFANDWQSPNVELIKNLLVSGIDLSPDEKQLAIVSTFGVRLVDLEAGTLQRTIDAPYRFGSPDVVYSPDGKLLARGGARREKASDDSVLIWSTSSGQQLTEIICDTNQCRFSRDTKWLAIGESDFHEALSVWPIGNAETLGPRLPLKYTRIDRVEENTHTVGKTAQEFAERWQPTWGKAHAGLQYGLALTTASNTFTLGEQVSMVAFVRNASDQAIQIDFRPDMFGHPPRIVGTDDSPVRLSKLNLLGAASRYRDTLRPGEIFGPLYLNVALGNAPLPHQRIWTPFWPVPKAGRYHATHQVILNYSAPGTTSPVDEGDAWRQVELTSGGIEFTVAQQSETHETSTSDDSNHTDVRAIVTTDRAGRWQNEEVEIEFETVLVHGADTTTSILLRWHKNHPVRARSCRLQCAWDNFGNRQEWMAVWEQDEPVLWYATGWTANDGKNVDATISPRPKIYTLHRVDFRNADCVVDHQYDGWPESLDIPDEITAALDARFDIPNSGVETWTWWHRATPGTNQPRSIDGHIQIFLDEGENCRVLDVDPDSPPEQQATLGTLANVIENVMHKQIRNGVLPGTPFRASIGASPNYPRESMKRVLAACQTAGVAPPQITNNGSEPEPEDSDAKPVSPSHNTSLPDSLNVMSVGFDNSGVLWSVATQSTLTLRKWNVESGQKLSDVTLELNKHANRYLTGELQLSPDRSRVMAILDGKVMVWDTATGKIVRQLNAPDGQRAHRGLSCSADFSRIACGLMQAGGFLPPNVASVIWDVNSGQVLTTVTHAGAVQIQSTALSPDGRWLATGSQEAGLGVWDASSGELKHHLPNKNTGRKHPDPEVTLQGASQVLALRFSPDSRRLAVADLLGVKIVDVATGESVHDFAHPYRFGRCGLVFSSNGHLLARVGTDKSIPIWNADTGALIAELSSESHSGSFSQDGQRFAVGLSDQENGIRIWNIDSNRPDENARRPWRARGRVVDGSGRPLAGVTVRAATGIGTLLGGGSGITDAEGHYDFRFGMGIVRGDTSDSEPDPQTQYALISAQLEGHFEQNLNRHGNGIASLKPVKDDQLTFWNVEPEQVCLPDTPREVNFVMLPAARVSGTLIDQTGLPLKEYSVSLTGNTLPPGSSVLAQVRTDDQGRFDFGNIPTTATFRFVVRKPKSELKPPWNDSWASAPMTFVDPGENELAIIFNVRTAMERLTVKKLMLQIVGPGVHSKTAERRASQGWVFLPSNGERLSAEEIVVREWTLTLDNREVVNDSSPEDE